MREAVRARAILGVLLLASLTLVLLDMRGSGAAGGLRGLTSSIVGPIEQAAASVSAPFLDAFHRMTGFSDPATRTAEAQGQLEGLVNGDAAAAETARQAGELQSMLKLAGLGQMTVIPARVIAYGSAQNFSGTVTVDAGSADGLAPELTVINGSGLVGKVLSVTASTATIQLITDSESVVGARAEGTGEIGALQGTGSPSTASLRLLDAESPFKLGDRLVTFGSPDGKPFAAGIPVGTITGFKGEPGQADRFAVVDPAVPMTSLDIVGVLVVPVRTDPRDSLLPPNPSASPAVPSPAATP